MSSTILDVSIPQGYMQMPLTDIGARFATVAQLTEELAPPDMKRLAHEVLPAYALMLEALAEMDARYCGIGRHTSSTGELVISCLTVCVVDSDEKRNPRLVLKELVTSRVEAGDAFGATEVLEVDGRPMLFAERVVGLPAPEIPGRAQLADTTPTYQLEAVVPAGDGSTLAAIEMSTASVERGPEFRKMIVDIARSVAFTAAVDLDQPSSLNL
ncbi:hypothetical protein D5S18_23995 [Nocardia panacis]|uniref:Uncharacterized protein n=1 Tax=Nocardia panacis TaxID=2340916 RepID=A0A3A4K2S8_9NOCA|nr:hypothetical protein [Nocardia panacis]RJO72224.1 hypothetical protein D5S18_23995 [Nocardia panacis]